ncbi:biotin--[acetyl-CoA-carboxylase] ligase [Ferrimicrobium sp.]|uniref:biotin--[acetyl-CoA-carboxylase] ligase n=1 Tax=Ferrimicrobium sp. TaxID=2926050 RepID=UPI00262B4A5B|nr:biotin--[acetyl-CoA-carboxylase] ligase [Ferrimicrobium sp.]
MISTAPWRIILLDETDSTNRTLSNLFARVSTQRLVVVADHQRAGRGRRGRAFHDLPRSTLACSVLVRLPRRAEVNLLPMAVGNAIVFAIRGLGVAGVTLKWPNDLMVGEAKLGGMLIDGIFDGSSHQVVIGLGVNLTATPTLEDARNLCCLNEAIEGEPAEDFFSLRDSLLMRFLEELDDQLSQLLHGHTELLLQTYRCCLSTLGRRVQIQYPEEMVVGLAEDVDQEGCLLVRTASGQVAVHVGDIEHLGVVNDR